MLTPEPSQLRQESVKENENERSHTNRKHSVYSETLLDKNNKTKKHIKKKRNDGKNPTSEIA